MADLSKYRGSGGNAGGNAPSSPESPPPAAPPPAAPAPPPTKAGKVATVALLGLGVAAIGAKGKAWLDSKKAPEVAVTCTSGANGVDCELEHKVGPKANACFSVEVACAGGKPATGKTCQTVDAKGKARVSILDLADWSGCKAGAVKVADLKVDKAP
jgi:hypothetical protein